MSTAATYDIDVSGWVCRRPDFPRCWARQAEDVLTYVHAYMHTQIHADRQRQTDIYIPTNISTYVRPPVCLHARTPACTPARDAHTSTRARTHPHPDCHTIPQPHPRDTHTPTHARHGTALHCAHARMPVPTRREATWTSARQRARLDGMTLTSS